MARELLGQILVRQEPEGPLLSGIITETEAYIGMADLGCHAKSGMTPRNRTMWGPPGHSYVYFTYGMHWMLNFVTESEGQPGAVLIRGLFPISGTEIMQRRRGIDRLSNLTDGPAKLCQAFLVDKYFDGADLCDQNSLLFVETRSPVPGRFILNGPRIGLNTVPEPWKSMPWRFRIPFKTAVELWAGASDGLGGPGSRAGRGG